MARSPQKSIRKAIFLLIVLVILLFLINLLVSHGLPGRVGQVFEQPQGPAYVPEAEIDSSRRDLLNSRFSGFWTSVESAGGYALSRRLEYKKNGIIWQVDRQIVRLDDTTVDTSFWAANGYVNPFSPQERDSTIIVCEVRLLRQVYITSTDTCYGPSQQDLAWEFARRGDNLIVNTRQFHPFDSQDVSSFFPDGLIDLVDDVRIEPCPPGRDFESIAFGFLRAALQRDSTRGHRQEYLHELFSGFYVPLVISRMLTDYTVVSTGRTTDVVLDMVVAFSGEVSAVTLESPQLRNRFLRERITDRVTTFVFPRGDSASEDVRFRDTIRVPY